MYSKNALINANLRIETNLQIFTNSVMKGKLLYPDLSYKIIGICFDAHNEIGRFGREKQYANLIEKNLKEKRIEYERECLIGDSGNIADFIVDDKVILELKAQKFVSKDEYFQTQRYLQAADLKLGILVNFRQKHLTPRRIIKYDLHKERK
jgi:GxxExxY protein